jgi:hypothetical protein
MAAFLFIYFPYCYLKKAWYYELMQIEEFQKKITELLGYKDEDGIEWVAEELTLYPAADGCLSSTFRDEQIPCEDSSWEKSFDEIVKYISEHRKPGELEWEPNEKWNPND